MAWSGTWARFGASDEGLASYLRHLAEVREALAKVPGPPVTMRNGWPMLDSFHRFVLGNAILPAKLQQLKAAAASRSPQLRMRA